jgi:thioredoxin-like negative regulator of GroEL
MSEMEVLVACLGAQWCGTCRDDRAAFDAAAGAAGARFAWIDIEDHPEVAGDLEIENFPTLLIAAGDRVLFFGTITPHAATLSSLVERAARDGLGEVRDPSILALAARARVHVEG